jgi:CheY-like chemotaxis protein
MFFAGELDPLLPLLRRYARAAIGNRIAGDRHVASMTERVAEWTEADDYRCSKVGLLQYLADSLARPKAIEDLPDESGSRPAEPLRQSLLLTGLEGLSEADAGWVLRMSADELRSGLELERRVLARVPSTEVLIIEDEFFISRDLARIVTELGHRISARAKTHAQAAAAAMQRRPGLILADVTLADGSRGIDAVAEIDPHGQIPTIFITAYPEQLLTGADPEPAFVIGKPYNVDQVRTLIGHALSVAARPI